MTTPLEKGQRQGCRQDEGAPDHQREPGAPARFRLLRGLSRSDRYHGGRSPVGSLGRASGCGRSVGAEREATGMRRDARRGRRTAIRRGEVRNETSGATSDRSGSCQKSRGRIVDSQAAGRPPEVGQSIPWRGGRMRRLGAGLTALAVLVLAACADGTTEARDEAGTSAAFARRQQGNGGRHRSDTLPPPHDSVPPRPPHDSVPPPPHDSVPPPPPPDSVPPPPDSVPPPPPPDSLTVGDLSGLLH